MWGEILGVNDVWVNSTPMNNLYECLGIVHLKPFRGNSKKLFGH